MNCQPLLKGTLLILEPLQASHHEALFKAASDPLIWELHPQADRYKLDVFAKFFSEALESKGALVIRDSGTQEIIGTSRFYDLADDRSSVIIGYTFLTRPYWGGRFNKELKQLMVNYALQFVKTIYFQVGLGNKRSQRAMEKLGAINTGIQEVVISYGPPKKSYIYKIEQPL